MKGEVYFIRDQHDRIKIGFSKNTAKRKLTLQAAHGADLVLLGTIPGTIAFEKSLHQRFVAERLSGEWFRATPALLSAIEDLVSAPPLPLTEPTWTRKRNLEESEEMASHLIAYLRAKHPTQTALRVSEDTGIGAGAVAQWLARRSLPNGAATAAMVCVYGPTFLAMGFRSLGAPIPPCLEEAIALERTEQIVGDLLSLTRELSVVAPIAGVDLSAGSDPRDARAK